jgi:hypothetical protein
MSRDALLIVAMVAWGLAAGLAYGAIQLWRFSEAYEAPVLYSGLCGAFAFVAAVVGGSCARAGIRRANDSGGDHAAGRDVMACPYCGQNAMTLWRKCILSPDTAVACASCGKKVGVPWGAITAAVPVALGIIAAVRLPVPWSIAGAVGGALGYVAIQRYLVPLLGRDVWR